MVRGDEEVLHGLSFTVPRGGITGLLGPSGCGKTTLMRSVVGVQIIESGGVDVLGAPAGSAELRPRVGYVTQAPSVYGDITVGENLRYFARVLGADAARVDEVIKTVALHEHDRVANKLSGGQRSRISLATAMLAEPDLLVLDEPTVGLDPVLRVELWNTFTSLAEGGTTLLVSSHVMDEAERCDSLLLMRDGDLLATETPDGLRSRTGEQDLEDAFLALIKEQGGGLSPRITVATATRVLTQLRRDPRTIALLLVVPAALLTLIKFVFDHNPGAFDRIGGPLVGLFPFITMFLVTSITMLRERTTGTLERLMTMPLAKLDILLGYGLAFGLVGTAQALITSGVAFGLLDLEVAGSTAAVILLAIGNALLGMSLGLFVSAFAQTEFQAIQFMPAFVFPQLLLCGLFVARDQMAGALEAVSYALPLTYAYDALDRVTSDGSLGGRGTADVLVTCGVILLALALGAATLRRRTA